MKAKLLTISLMVGLFMGCHDFLDVKPVGIYSIIRIR